MTTITTRSGKGSPLTNNEVDANFTNLNDDKVEASGDSMTGNLSFGDNNKVILGSGNDLQLYHDGTDSIINEGTAGNLLVQGATIKLQTANGAKDYLVATPSAEITLYHNNTARLATTATGIDVSGTATMDGLTVDGSATITQSAGSDFLKFDVDGTTDEAILGIDSTDFIIDIDPTNVRASSNFVVKNDGTTNLTLNSSGNLDVNGTVTADGLTVDGTATMTVSDNSDVLTLKSTDADENSGPRFALTRDSGSPADNDYVGLISFNADDDGGNATRFSYMVTQIMDASNGSEDGALRFFTTTAGSEVETLSLVSGQVGIGNSSPTTALDVTGTVTADGANIDGAAVFNESGADVDFRIESSGKANMLLVDAGNNRVGIGTGVPDTTLHVASTSSGGVLTLESTSSNNSAGPNILLYRSSSTPAADDNLGKILYRGTNSAAEDVDYVSIESVLTSPTDGAEQGQYNIDTMVDGTNRNRLRINNSETVFNDGGRDLDFRVESDTQSHMLFVDAGNNHVNIGSSSDYGGRLNVVTGDNTTTLALVSTDADASVGPKLVLRRDSASPADNDNAGQILFTAENDAGADTTYGFIRATLEDVTDGTEDGILDIQTITAGSTRSRIKVAGAETVINESSQDLDFRVESDNDTHAFFVQGSDGNVGIGTSSPAFVLDVNHPSDNGLARFTSGDADAYITLSDVNSSSAYNKIGVITHDMYFNTNNAERMRIDASGHVIAPYGVTLGTAVGTYAAANTLDDYEEGTWTPTLEGSNTAGVATYTKQSGTYTKVGRQVTVTLDVRVSAWTTNPTGSFRIGGLPFTSTNIPSTGAFMSSKLNFDDVSITAVLYMAGSTDSLRLYLTRDDATWVQQSIGGEDMDVLGTITYFV